MGWRSYFAEMTRFLRSAANNYGSANSQYTEYCINRLAICYGNTSSVLQILESSDDQALLTNIAGDLNELLLHISEMYGLWSAYLMIHKTHTITTELQLNHLEEKEVVQDLE